MSANVSPTTAQFDRVRARLNEDDANSVESSGGASAGSLDENGELRNTVDEAVPAEEAKQAEPDDDLVDADWDKKSGHLYGSMPPPDSVSMNPSYKGAQQGNANPHSYEPSDAYGSLPPAENKKKSKKNKNQDAWSAEKGIEPDSFDTHETGMMSMDEFAQSNRMSRGRGRVGNSCMGRMKRRCKCIAFSIFLLVVLLAGGFATMQFLGKGRRSRGSISGALGENNVSGEGLESTVPPIQSTTTTTESVEDIATTAAPETTTTTTAAPTTTTIVTTTPVPEPEVIVTTIPPTTTTQTTEPATESPESTATEATDPVAASSPPLVKAAQFNKVEVRTQIIDSLGFQPSRESPQGKALDWMTTIDPHQVTAATNVMQRYTVVVLIYSLIGDGDLDTLSHASWFSNLSECLWDGVECLNAVVVKIDFGEKGLTGEIPPEIKFLSALAKLDLSHNRISGKIPRTIRHLVDLILLDVSDNLIEGTIPDGLYRCTALQYLYLSRNKLTGGISPNVANLEQIVQFRIEQNQMSGKIPDELFDKLKSMLFFIARSNQFNGTVPESVSSRRKLFYFDVADNKLSGPLPSFQNCTALRYMYLSCNQFDGAIPFAWTTLDRVIEVHIDNNSITGTPPSFKTFPKLLTLKMNDNGFTEKIPKETCKNSVFEYGEIVNIDADCDVCSCKPFCDFCGKSPRV